MKSDIFKSLINLRYKCLKSIIFQFAAAFLSVGVLMVISINSYSSTLDTNVGSNTESNELTPLKGADVPEVVMHNYVQLIIANVTTPDMTNDEKLYASYVYCLENMKYKRDTANANGTLIKDYALEAFMTGRGNCYRYASMFAYIANELGYDVKVQAGQCTSAQGGWTPHSWCLITYPDGTELIYDLSFGDSFWGKKNYYGIKASEHSRKLKVEEEWRVLF